MKDSKTLRRFYTDVGVVMYSLSHRGLSRARYLYGVIRRYFNVEETYVVFYGYPRPKAALPIATYFIDPPYSRGKIFVVGANLVQNPVTLFINLDSKCIKEESIVEAVESLVGGIFQLYMSIPLTDSEFLEAYRSSVYRVLENLGLLLGLRYPSYTIVAGRRKFFLSADYTPWSVEHLIAIDLPSSAVKVVDDSCIDTIPRELSGFGSRFMDMLAKKLTTKLATKGVQA